MISIGDVDEYQQHEEPNNHLAKCCIGNVNNMSLSIESTIETCYFHSSIYNTKAVSAKAREKQAKIS